MKRQRSKSTSSLDVAGGFLVYPLLIDRYFLVALKKGQVIHQTGFINIIPFAGSLNIDGYTLPLKRRQAILSSDWMPARCITAGTFDLKLSVKSLQRVLKDIGIQNKSSSDISFDNIDESQIGSAFIVESLDRTMVDWMILAEDSVMQTIRGDISGSVDSKEPMTWRHSAELVAGRGLLATKEVMDFLKVDLFEIKPTWRTALGGLLGSLRTQTHDLPDMKVLLCGAKGVGKSSALRCAINRFLSVASHIFVLDCDLGQPEFSAPGLVSLHVVTEPVLAPSHLNLRTPAASVFIGDVTPKNCPHMVEQAVKALYEQYLKLSREKKESYRKQKGPSSSSSASTKNIFDALTEETNSTDTTNRQQFLCPLLVNTDGYTRYMGAEILSSVLSIVRPTHVCQIYSEKDSELPPVEQYLTANDNQPCQLLTMEPGSLSPGKASAADLRTLRLVSHFLRTSEFMQSHINEMIKAEDSIANSAVPIVPPSSSEYQVYGPSSTFPVTIPSNSKRCFSIRNGSIFDRDGWLTQALMHAPAVAAPLSSVDLCIPSTDVAPHLFPAAFAASFVSVSRYPSLRNETSTPEPASEVVSISLRLPDSIHTESCTVNVSTHWACLEHTELGIVRHVNTQLQSVILTLPCPTNGTNGTESSEKETRLRPDRMALVRASFPLPVQLMYNPTSNSNAFISGDLVGEGSNVMKARKNMKRKAYGV